MSFAENYTMKASEEYKDLTRTTARLPKDIYKKIENQAKENRRSINDELIFILSEYFGDSFVKLDSVIKKAVAMYAETKGFTVTEATNYLVSTRISVMEEIHNIIIAEADKAHEQQIADYEDEIQAAPALKKKEAS